MFRPANLMMDRSPELARFLGVDVGSKHHVGNLGRQARKRPLFGKFFVTRNWICSLIDGLDMIGAGAFGESPMVR